MKPEAALPAVVPVELVLARSDEAVAAVSTIEAYPTGFEFNIDDHLPASGVRTGSSWALHPLATST